MALVPTFIANCAGLYSVFGRTVLSDHAYIVWGANGADPRGPGHHCFKAGSANRCTKASALKLAEEARDAYTAALNAMGSPEHLAAMWAKHTVASRKAREAL